MGTNPDEIETICECQYNLTLSSDGEGSRETKDNCNNAPSIHEIDEDSETEEETAILEQTNSIINKTDNIVVQNTDDTSGDESVYKGELFCSDESCDESEITNVTSGSLVSDSLLRATDFQRSGSSKSHDARINGSRWKDNPRDDELCSPCTTAADRLAKSKRCKRWNMSFTDEEMRRIERENEHLLRKIMAQQKPRHKIFDEHTVQPRTSSSAINRRKLQKKIENDNMLLLRRIQQAKSCVFTNTSKMGCRLTFL